MYWKTIRILLVDPDESFVKKAERVITGANKSATLTRARTLTEARAKLAATQNDVVIADLDIADGMATELYSSGEQKARNAVIVLYHKDQEQRAAAAMEAGAIDCYLKNGSDMSDLPRVTMRALREWRHIVDRERAEKLIVQLHSQIQQFQRLVTSGLIGRGAAHDIANLLTPILGYADNALSKIPPRGQARNEIEHIIRVARLAKTLINDVVNQKTGEDTGRETVDVKYVVRDVLDLVKPIAPPGVEIRCVAPHEDVFAEVDTSQLCRIVVNLCLNAFEAMRSSGGVLRVDTSIQDTDQAGWSDGAFVYLTVTDTGRGMDRQTAVRIFEPFFTTKPHGEGTGLGLSIVHDILEKHGGGITVESSPGKGSVFRVFLPREEKQNRIVAQTATAS